MIRWVIFASNAGGGKNAWLEKGGKETFQPTGPFMAKWCELPGKKMALQGGSTDGQDEEDFSITLKPRARVSRRLNHWQRRRNHQRNPNANRYSNPTKPEWRGVSRHFWSHRCSRRDNYFWLCALHLIISKLLRDGAGILVGHDPRLNLVIPNASCGCILGKGGVTIRSFAEDSQAT